MRIAVTYENGQVFQHFGHTELFKVYDVDNGKVTSTSVISTNGSGHGALAEILKELNVTILICGGIGDGAKRALAEKGIELYPGVDGSADGVVEAFLSGHLNYNPATTCTHHEEHHDGSCGNSCGDHSC